jgi:glycosyltransferase involved in cell wall biosynthesis
MDTISVMLVSIVPPRNDCGVRIVMYRHLVDRCLFKLHVASNADFADDLMIHTKIKLPFPIQKIKKSRFGPCFKKWIIDFENFLWPHMKFRQIERAIAMYKPDILITLAENSICYVAKKLADKYQLPLAVLFLDWVPIMDGHFGHKSTISTLDRRFRQLYKECDLAFCTSDGMKEELGPHSNSHVIYPMPGKHSVPNSFSRSKKEKFRLVYVGNAQGFYGRMLQELLHELRTHTEIEMIIVGPTQDWPDEDLLRAKKNGTCLGFMPPNEAAEVLAGADALLVVMSFEREHELFMRTSFTTKFLDYSAFAKPVILWGPDYCTPSRLAMREEAALVVNSNSAQGVITAAKKLMDEPQEVARLCAASRRLSQTVFSPDRLQEIFEKQVKKLVSGSNLKNACKT